MTEFEAQLIVAIHGIKDQIEKQNNILATEFQEMNENFDNIIMRLFDIIEKIENI